MGAPPSMQRSFSSAVTNKLGDFWQFPPSASRSFCPGTTKAGYCTAETVGRSVGQFVIQLTERVQ
eukprot:6162283-Prymnesium_polylepis.1